MRVDWSVALVAIAVLQGCSANSGRKYGLEPAPQWLFVQDHTPTPCEPRTGLHVFVSSPNRPAHIIRRADRMTISRAELPVLSMHVAPSTLEISSVNSDEYSVQVCAEAGAATENDAQSLLDEVRLTLDDKMVSLSTPKFVQGQRSDVIVQVQAPQEAPITINGEYAAMRVIGMHAPVHVSTTHARVTLLDTTGDVDATAAEFGVVDFSGERGNVRLDSAWEINLNFTVQKFDGSLNAKAANGIRVLLPPGFSSALEAIVPHRTDFACRADICDRVSFHKRDGKFAFTLGSGDAALHFISQAGPVVIDSVNPLPRN